MVRHVALSLFFFFFFFGLNKTPSVLTTENEIGMGYGIMYSKLGKLIHNLNVFDLVIKVPLNAFDHLSDLLSPHTWTHVEIFQL